MLKESTQLPAPVNKFQEMLLETSSVWAAGGSSSPCASLLNQTQTASLARDAAVTSAGDKLSYAAFVEINPKIRVSAT